MKSKMSSIFAVVVFGLLLTVVLALPLDNPDANQPEDVDEYGEFFEGDMILTQEQRDELFSQTLNGKINPKYRWPNKTVPYQHSSNHSQEEQNYIEKALKVLASVSCLKFVKRTNEEDYVQLQAESDGCYSKVGYHKGKQILNLKKKPIETRCFRLGTIMHEFLHALGFHHMHSGYDRNKYVTIWWDNIKPVHAHNFEKRTKDEVTYFNTTYDYLSVMHYSAYSFSINGEPTIVPTDEKYLKIIGQRKQLSKKDIIKLNAMYDCDKES